MSYDSVPPNATDRADAKGAAGRRSLCSMSRAPPARLPLGISIGNRRPICGPCNAGEERRLGNILAR